GEPFELAAAGVLGPAAGSQHLVDGADRRLRGPGLHTGEVQEPARAVVDGPGTALPGAEGVEVGGDLLDLQHGAVQTDRRLRETPADVGIVGVDDALGDVAAGGGDPGADGDGAFGDAGVDRGDQQLEGAEDAHHEGGGVRAGGR